jgi:hypothetical protein
MKLRSAFSGMLGRLENRLTREQLFGSKLPDSCAGHHQKRADRRRWLGPDRSVIRSLTLPVPGDRAEL